MAKTGASSRTRLRVAGSVGTVLVYIYSLPSIPSEAQPWRTALKHHHVTNTEISAVGIVLLLGLLALINLAPLEAGYKRIRRGKQLSSFAPQDPNEAPEWPKRWSMGAEAVTAAAGLASPVKQREAEADVTIRPATLELGPSVGGFQLPPPKPEQPGFVAAATPATVAEVAESLFRVLERFEVEGGWEDQLRGQIAECDQKIGRWLGRKELTEMRTTSPSGSPPAEISTTGPNADLWREGRRRVDWLRQRAG